MKFEIFLAFVLGVYVCTCMVLPASKRQEGEKPAAEKPAEGSDSNGGSTPQGDAADGNTPQGDTADGDTNSTDSNQEGNGNDTSSDDGSGATDIGPDLSNEIGEEGNAEPETAKDLDEEEKAEENPDLFEGDIKVSRKEMNDFTKGALMRRDAITSTAKLWTNGRVPYILDPSFGKDREETLKKAIKEYNDKTCIKVVPKTSKDKDYIRFFVDNGCYATSIGKRQGELKISIGKGCNWVGTIIHEIMHAIGFFHEQSRLDRDQFITIFWQNIKRNRESQFWNYGHGEADYLNEPYDYDSVMHYHKTAFSFNNESPTIVAKNKPQRRLGQRKGLSPIDVKQVNKLYKCSGKGGNGGGCGGGGKGCGGRGGGGNGRGGGGRGGGGRGGGRGGGGRGGGGRGKGRGRGPEEMGHQMEIKVLKFTN